MTGKRHRSRYRKSRKGKGFAGVPKQQKIEGKKSSNKHGDSGVGGEGTPRHRHIDEDSDDCEQPLSASRKKMRMSCSSSVMNYTSSDEEATGEPSNVPEYRLINLENLRSVFEIIHKCEGDIMMEENKDVRTGLMSSFVIRCSYCGDISTLETSMNLATKGRSYDANRRAVYHSIETGAGYEGLSSYCSINNMPSMSRAAYYKQVDIIADTLQSVANEEMISAGQKLRKLLGEETGQEFSDTDIVDVAVSFDGTWAKRGFTSLTGVVFVISVDTDEVLDYHVLSKACQE